MDYRKAAAETVQYIGGKDNIVSAAHCATRLRLVIADNTKVDKKALENAEGVKGVFEASGQLQIIFGTGVVNKVYDEFIALTGITAASKEDVKQAAASKANPFQHGICLSASPDRLFRRESVQRKPISGRRYRYDHGSPEPAECMDHDRRCQ